MLINFEEISEYIVSITVNSKEYELTPSSINFSNIKFPFIATNNKNDVILLNQLINNGNFIITVSYLDEEILHTKKITCRMCNNIGAFGGKYELIIVNIEEPNIKDEQQLIDIIQVKSLRRNS